jgi:hypothetical protein
MHSESPHPEENRFHGISRLLIVPAILLIGLATVSSNVSDPDLWGHVQYGREVLRDGTLPRTATWTYAAEGAPWVNHENIAELMLAGTVDTFGPAGLPWMKLTVAVTIFGLMIFSARRSGAGWLSIGVIVMIVAANLQFHWHFRPQILTYMSLAMLLSLWQYVFEGFDARNPETILATTSRLRWLWLLLPLMCFWANSHGGFAAGVCIMLAYHGLICLQLIHRRGFRHRRFLLHLSMVTVAAVLATLINPYGVELWQFMLSALTLPRPEIADWGAPELIGMEATRLWCLIAVGAIALSADQRRDYAKLVILGLLLWQSLSHCRHLSIFAIVCGFWIPRALQQVGSSFQQTFQKLQKLQTQSEIKQGRPTGRFRLVALIMLISISMIKLLPTLQQVPVDRNEYPVSAMQFLYDHQLHGRTLVTFNWAQYAIGCFAADDGPLKESRVAVDGRFETCYPREITDICFDFWLGTDDPGDRYRSPYAPPFSPSLALEFEMPDLVLLARDQRPSARIMQQHRETWALLYQDSLAQIWGRRSRYDVPGLKDYLSPTKRRISDDPQVGTVPWPAFPADHPSAERITLSPAANADVFFR